MSDFWIFLIICILQKHLYLLGQPQVHKFPKKSSFPSKSLTIYPWWFLQPRKKTPVHSGEFLKTCKHKSAEKCWKHSAKMPSRWNKVKLYTLAKLKVWKVPENSLVLQPSQIFYMNFFGHCLQVVKIASFECSEFVQ